MGRDIWEGRIRYFQTLSETAGRGSCSTRKDKPREGEDGGERGSADREETEPKAGEERPNPAAGQQIGTGDREPEMESPGEGGTEGASDLFVHLKK